MFVDLRMGGGISGLILNKNNLKLKKRRDAPRRVSTFF